MLITAKSTLIILALASFGVCRSSDNDELLEIVRLSHRSARQSIRQFSCTYLMQQTLPNKAVMASGKYSRSGEIVSIKDGNAGISTLDSVIRNGQCKSVGRSWSGEKIEYSATIFSEVQYFSWGDIWRRMAIDHSDQDGRRCNYDMVLDRIGKNARLARDRIAGRECVRIEVAEKHKSGRTMMLKMWHDVGYNYLVRKFESYDISDPTNRNVVEISEFVEAAPGIVVPTKCQLDVIRADHTERSYVTEISDVRLNQPIDETAFDLPSIPKGTNFQDFIRGTSGQIGHDWKTEGPTTPIRRDILTPSSNDPVEGQTTETERWSLDKYLLCTSIIVFVLCIPLLLRRRGHTRGTSDEIPK